MYKLFNNISKWEVSADNKTVKSGDFKTVVKYCVKDIGFDLKEVNFAVEEMLTNDDDTAHFGMHKTFIFSSSRKLKGVA